MDIEMFISCSAEPFIVAGGAKTCIYYIYSIDNFTESVRVR